MKILIFILAIIVIFVIVFLVLDNKAEAPIISVNSFEECIKAGNAVLESYPRQCVAEDGKTFTEYIGNELEKLDLIKIESVRPNQVIISPLYVNGFARGFWFFEASFPIKLYDESGNEIALVVAQAKEDWMTENFVPFEAILEFQAPENRKGTLIFEKDNPSGLPENDDKLEMPIIFYE